MSGERFFNSTSWKAVPSYASILQKEGTSSAHLFDMPRKTKTFLFFPKNKEMSPEETLQLVKAKVNPTALMLNIRRRLNKIKDGGIVKELDNEEQMKVRYIQSRDGPRSQKHRL